jgi:hypothetical protein
MNQVTNDKGCYLIAEAGANNALRSARQRTLDDPPNALCLVRALSSAREAMLCRFMRSIVVGVSALSAAAQASGSNDWATTPQLYWFTMRVHDARHFDRRSSGVK